MNLSIFRFIADLVLTNIIITIEQLSTIGSAPSYFHSLITIYIPLRSLRSASERRLVVPSQRGTKSLSRTFFIHRSWLVEWTFHPHPECWIPDNFQDTPENSSLPSSLEKKQPSLSFLNFALFPLIYIYIFNNRNYKRNLTSQSLDLRLQ